MVLSQYLETAKDRIREGAVTSEAAVSQGILLPVLHGLGWPVFDTAVVTPEYSVEGRRVDFALCHPAKRPSVFIEAKKIGLAEGADRQLFEYAFHLGVPMAILTDGQEWSFYLPGEQGRYDERRVYKLDLLERSTKEAAERLTRYLDYKRVCSGEALISARSDYQNVARVREIEATFPKAWSLLLEEQDSLLLELLADKVEDLCGYKPDLDACSQFFDLYVRVNISRKTTPLRNNDTQLSPVRPKTNAPIRSTLQTPTRFEFTFKGTNYKTGSAREVMTQIFQLLAQEDGAFLERFASRKHGKKRRYLAQNKYELYPGRPDLVEEHSIEILTGWWMGTNYSRKDIQKIIDLACEVAGPKLGALVQVNVG